MKSTLVIFLFAINIAMGQSPVGVFQDHGDVGGPARAGSTVYDAGSKTYTIKGSGGNIWFSKDEFQFAWQKLSGDFTLTANFEFVGKGTNNHRKIGWMIRATPDGDAIHYSAVLHGDGLTVLQWRPVKGNAMRDPEDEIFAKGKNYTVVQLERLGKKIIMRAGSTGGPLEVIGETEAQNLPDTVMAGIFICAHDATVVEEAKVTNVKIVKK